MCCDGDLGQPVRTEIAFLRKRERINSAVYKLSDIEYVTPPCLSFLLLNEM